jgi:hypothetical protein
VSTTNQTAEVAIFFIHLYPQATPGGLFLVFRGDTIGFSSNAPFPQKGKDQITKKSHLKATARGGVPLRREKDLLC